MADKVAILGTVPNSRVMAPYNDPSWDIWCCSAGNSQAGAPPRVTEWYEIHSIVDLHAPENQHWYPDYIKWLNAQTFPVFMQEPNEDVPRAKVFPRKILTDRFGPNAQGKTNWFTSTPAWMFAFAIHRGYKTIGVFGVDMAAAEEHYTGQKAGLLRWFEIGRELGINVIVPLESTLSFHYPLYGYAESSRQGRALLVRENELKARLQHFENMYRSAERDIHYSRGALDQVIFSRRTYVSGLNDAEIDEVEYAKGFNDFVDAHQSVLSREPLVKAEPVAAQPVTRAPLPTKAPTLEDFEMQPLPPQTMAVRLKKSKSNGPLPKEGE